MYKLEGFENLDLISFIKKNNRSVYFIIIVFFIVGFFIGYVFFPSENIVGVENEEVLTETILLK